jgi:hypothetical protein
MLAIVTISFDTIICASGQDISVSEVIGYGLDDQGSILGLDWR